MLIPVLRPLLRPVVLTPALAILLGVGAFSPRHLFADPSAVGIHLETYDPNSILRRRNLLTYSEDFTNAAWLKSTAVVTANATVAPDGTMTADRLETSGLWRAPIGSEGVGRTYIVSIYAKAVGAGGTIRLQSGASYSPRGTSTFDLVAGTASLDGVIESVGDGWYRCWTLVTLTADTTDRTLYFDTPGTGVYVWGAQVELGSTPTTYQKVTDWNTEFLAAGGDRVTMFQDVARTIPVWAVEQSIASIRDTSRAGSTVYVTQPTSGFQAKLKARVNLLTKTEQFNDAAWSVDNSLATDPVVTPNYNGAAAPDGTFTATRLQLDKTGGTFSRFQQILTATANVSYEGSVWMRTTSGAGSSNVSFRIGSDASEALAKTVTGEWQRFEQTFLETSASPNFQILLWDSVASNDETADILIWHPDLRTSADAALNIPAYQAVRSATDYDTDGFPHGFVPDQSDDGYQLSLDLSGVNKLDVFVSGQLKSSDAAAAALIEHTANSGTTAGGFAIFAPGSAGSASFQGRSGGSVAGAANATSAASYAAPRNGVLHLQTDIASDVCRLKLDGTQIASDSTDQGSGNYANSTLNLCFRNAASLRAGGRICSITVRGSATANLSAGHEAQMLRYLRRLSKAI